MASSADGSRLVAVASGGSILVSFDSGATWSNRTPSGATLDRAVAAISRDGTYITVGYRGGMPSSNGAVYLSSDLGQSWIERSSAGAQMWQAIAISGNGAVIVVGGAEASSGGGYRSASLYVSQDYGATWTEALGYSRMWDNVAISDDGSKMYATAQGRGNTVYSSYDAGAAWSEQLVSNSAGNGSVAVSADGVRVIVASQGEFIYASMDSGATWQQQDAAGARIWGALDVSSDGQRVAAGGRYTNIYVAGPEGPATATQPLADLAPAAMKSDPISAPLATATLSVTSSTCYTLDTPSVSVVYIVTPPS